MKAILICYTLEKTTQTQRTALNRELNGYTDYSNKGRYAYQREGMLTNIPHIKPGKSVIITKKQYKNKILKTLKKYKAKTNQYDIQINNKHLKKPTTVHPQKPANQKEKNSLYK